MSAGNKARFASQQAIMDWLKIRSRTLGWDAWLAYDRSVLNDSLSRDWAERLDTHPWAVSHYAIMPVVTNSLWEHLHGVRFGPPRVSFESSSIDRPGVTMEAKALCGVQLTVEKSGAAPKQILKIESYGPLQAPRVVAQVDVDDPDGVANAAGRVWIDLASGRDHQFSLSDTLQAQRRAGALFGERFSDMSLEQRTCTLNLLGRWDAAGLSPETVRARPYPAPADLRVDQGDGAIVLFIAAKGSQVGNLPTDAHDVVYPVPDGRRTTLLLSSYWLMTGMIGRALEAVSPEAELQFDNSDDPHEVVNSVVVTGGSLELRPSLDVDPFSSCSYGITASLSEGVSGSKPCAVRRAGDGLVLNWKGASFGAMDAPVLETEGPAGATALDMAWMLSVPFDFSTDANGDIKLAAPEDQRPWAKAVYRQGDILDPLHYSHFPALSGAAEAGVADSLHETTLLIGAGSNEIGRFRTEGVVFPGALTAHFSEAHLPNDVVAFGDVSCKRGAFLIEPAQACLQAAKSLQFEVNSDVAGLEWRAETIQGFTGGAGSISDSGLYEAPDSEEYEGDLILVRVTAFTSEHSSSAIVSVLSRTVMGNPLVFSAWPEGGGTRVAASSLDGTELVWRVESATGATLEAFSPDDGTLFDPGDRRYVPGAGKTGEFFSIDEIAATHPDTGEAHRIPVLVVERALRGSVLIREGQNLPEGQIQLDLDAGLGPIDGAVWAVRAGGGTIDQNGLYIVDPDSKDRFAIITATFYEPPIADLGNYLILPLPLISVDEVIRMLR